VNAMRVAPTVLTGLIASACVTINVYFPAVAAERAADRIIEDVWGDSARGQRPPAPIPQSQPTSQLQLPERIGLAAIRALEWITPSAHAQAQADLEISSPAIRSLTAAMESRHAQLKPLYESGAIGLTADGLVDVRDMNAVPLAQRNALRKLTAEENADRSALYREIARANKHPEWEGDIRQIFAKRWIERAPRGWWYRDAGGNWKQR
jgi:uncharacterized protein YdbL (DUF1318 family)